MTQQEYEAYMARFSDSDRSEIPDKGLENNLLKKCLKYCRDHGYPVWHDWSKGVNEAGWPDLSIYMPGKRHVMIELKAGNKKLRKEQEELRRSLMFLGFEVKVCRSYKRFIEIVEGRELR